MEIKQTPEEIAASIVDELEAMSMYARMAAEARDPVLRAILLNIAADEYGHARAFMVWQELTGAMSTPPARPADHTAARATDVTLRAADRTGGAADRAGGAADRAPRAAEFAADDDGLTRP